MIALTAIDLPPEDYTFATNIVHVGFTSWISIALFELLVLGLSVKVALSYFHSIREVHVWHKNSLAYVLLRDSVVFPLM